MQKSERDNLEKQVCVYEHSRYIKNSENQHCIADKWEFEWRRAGALVSMMMTTMLMMRERGERKVPSGLWLDVSLLIFDVDIAWRK
jgi:hypothetical protein